MVETTLPVSRKTATMRRPTGHDMVQAELLVKDSGQVAYQMALLSRCTVIDGKTLPYEDFLDLDAEDLTHLGKLEPSKPGESTQQQSSQSQKSQDGDGAIYLG